MLEGERLSQALASIGFTECNGCLARRVPLFDLIDPPLTFLLTLGKPGRFNPAEIQCLYLSHDERTAQAEFQRNLGNSFSDVATYWVEVSIARILDLKDTRIRRKLELSDDLLYASWRDRDGNAPTQKLGWRVFAETDFSAIRYPSIAAKAAGFEGSNYVIFKDKITAPDSVLKRGRSGSVLERWPEE